MSIHVISWVLEHSNERLGRRLVLLVLADHAKKDGTSAWPSVDTIAHEARMSRAQVIRCLSELRASEAIIERGKSRQGTKMYDVVMGGSHIATGRGLIYAEEGSQDETRTVLSTTVSSSLPKTQKNGSERKRNLIWDALTDIFGAPTTRTAETLRGKNVAELAAAGAEPEEILRRAKAWPLHFDGATLTGPALVKHWDALGREPLRRTR